MIPRFPQEALPVEEQIEEVTKIRDPVGKYHRVLHIIFAVLFRNMVSAADYTCTAGYPNQTNEYLC